MLAQLKKKASWISPDFPMGQNALIRIHPPGKWDYPYTPGCASTPHGKWEFPYTPASAHACTPGNSTGPRPRNFSRGTFVWNFHGADGPATGRPVEFPGDVRLAWNAGVVWKFRGGGSGCDCGNAMAMEIPWLCKFRGCGDSVAVEFP